MLGDQKKYLRKKFLDCSDVEELIDDYLDGDLHPLIADKLEGHVCECQGCKDVVRDTQRLLEVASRLDDKPLDQDVKTRLRVELNRRVGLSLDRPRPLLRLISSD